MYCKLSAFRLSLFFVLSLLLTACGGGDNSGTTNNFVLADAATSYTGEQRLTTLSTNNARDYLRLLFSPGLSAPDTALRSQTALTGIQHADSDFVHAQEKLLQRLKQRALNQHLYAQRAVSSSNPDDCDNNGTVHLSGELFDDVGKGQLSLLYTNCAVGGYLLNGNAVLLIYAINGSFSRLSSSTLGYNRIQAESLASGEVVWLTGTVDEVNDYTTGSVRTVIQLLRQNIQSGRQTLVDVIRQLAGGSGSVTMTGSLYDGIYGKVQVNTINPLTYNFDDKPVSGYFTLTGVNNSKAAITALGQQYDNLTNSYAIVLQLDVDADGDGFYENQSQLGVDEL